MDELEGTWFHSREEDRGDRIVYRGTSYDFPRARAPRSSLTIRPNGTVAFGEPGPADASTYSEGTWEVRGDVLTLSRAGRQESYVIEQLQEELLVLRRVSREG